MAPPTKNAACADKDKATHVQMRQANPQTIPDAQFYNREEAGQEIAKAVTASGDAAKLMAEKDSDSTPQRKRDQPANSRQLTPTNLRCSDNSAHAVCEGMRRQLVSETGGWG